MVRMQRYRLGVMQRLTIEEVRALARERGGECLSTEYKNHRTPLRWRCANGHEWQATLGDVKHSGYWCPTCAGRRRRLTIEDMRRIARERGGECLSEEYVNSRTPLLWRCAEGHQWEATPDSIRSKRSNGRGTWCGQCARRGATAQLTIGEMRELAASRGGECLSDT
jgi:hypothetical protein